MRPIVTDRVAWSVDLFVGLLVCHTAEPCKNGRTDRDIVWIVGSDGPTRNHVLDGVQITPLEGAALGERGAHCKVYIGTFYRELCENR